MVDEIIDFRCRDPEYSCDLFLGEVTVVVGVQDIAVDGLQLFYVFGDQQLILFFF